MHLTDENTGLELEKEHTFSDYDFLLLLTLNLFKNGASIVEKHGLEKELFEFYDDSNFHFLFEDICPKRKVVTEDEEYVELSDAFLQAYAYGSLVIIHEASSDVRSIIPYWTSAEMEEVFSQYDDKYNQGIQNLTTQLLDKRKENLHSSYVKKI